MTVFRLGNCFISYDNEVFEIFAVFFSTLNGFFDTMLFFSHPEVLKIIKRNESLEEILSKEENITGDEKHKERNMEEISIDEI